MLGNPKFLVLGLALVVPSVPNAVAAEGVSFGANASITYDDNIGFARVDEDKFDDVITAVGAEATFQGLGNVSLTGGVNYNHVSDLRDLSYYSLDLGVAHTGNFGTGIDGAWYRLGVKGSWLEYKDSPIRDGYRVTLTASTGRRLSENVSGSIGWQYKVRESTEDDFSGPRASRRFSSHNEDVDADEDEETGTAPSPSPSPDTEPDMADYQGPTEAMLNKPGDIFDLEGHSLFAYLQYSLDPVSAVFGQYTLFMGDVTSTQRPDNFRETGSDNPVAPDSAFGPGFYAWRVDADVHQVETGFKRQIGNRGHVRVSGKYIEALGDGNNDYTDVIVTLSGGLTF